MESIAPAPTDTYGVPLFFDLFAPKAHVIRGVAKNTPGDKRDGDGIFKENPWTYH